MSKRKKFSRSIGNSLLYRVSDMLDAPVDGLIRGCHIHLSDWQEAAVYGCLGVLVYEDEAIVLRTGKGHVHLEGKALDIISLIGDCITIRGHILSIRMTERSES